MNVYFVRHGESEGNAMNLHQDSYAKLSEKGINQAKALSKRFLNIKIDLIFSSSFTRAKQTTEIINKNIGKDIEYSDLFIERKRPSIIEGLHYLHPEAVKIKDQIKANYQDPEFKHSDEETFFEMKERAEKALKLLENVQKENVLVVSHGDFIRCILGIMVFEHEYDAKTDIKFADAFKSSNTGITLCEFEERWKVLAWNDHAHLG